MELSKNKIKYFASFEKKKTREAEGLFVVEGTKMVEELLKSSFTTECIVATEEWFSTHNPKCECYTASHNDIARISLLQSPQDVWALAHTPVKTEQCTIGSGLTLALDGVQDPGNMGTIIRLADWFGITQIVCSNDCVDTFNPKVVQATMGSIFRVPTHYVDLPEFLTTCNTPIFVADMEGENVYTAQIPNNAILVMGNEGNGISDAVAKRATHAIRIPSFNTTGKVPESLNVAGATAILCSEFCRKTL